MSTPLQKLAQKENWMLFVLTGMLGTLKHLKYYKEKSPTTYSLNKAIMGIQICIEDIKYEQSVRKEIREKAKGK